MATDGEKVRGLRDFFMDSFTVPELEMFLTVNGYREVAAAANQSDGSMRYCFNVAEALKRLGLIDGRFFGCLRKERPANEARIRVLEESWVVEEQPIPKSSGSAISRGARKKIVAERTAPPHHTPVTADEPEPEKTLLGSDGAKDSGTQKVVFSIHGIRTRGDWQKELSGELSRAGFFHEPLDYGWFSAISLLFPPSRRRQVKWFMDQYTKICDRYDSGNAANWRPSIIAHSFGTYLTARSMELFGLKFNRVIFCGSIVRRGFPWSEMVNRGQVQRVLNDFGRLDIWARVVEWVVSDAGQSGLRGFEDKANDKVIERENREFGHGDYFYRINYLEHWIPFLKGIDHSSPPLMQTQGKTSLRFLISASLGSVLVICCIALMIRPIVNYVTGVKPDRVSANCDDSFITAIGNMKVEDRQNQFPGFWAKYGGCTVTWIGEVVISTGGTYQIRACSEAPEFTYANVDLAVSSEFIGFKRGTIIKISGSIDSIGPGGIYVKKARVVSPDEKLPPCPTS